MKNKAAFALQLTVLLLVACNGTESASERHVVLESLDFDADGSGTGRMTATDIREGEGIPPDFVALEDRL